MADGYVLVRAKGTCDPLEANRPVKKPEVQLVFDVPDTPGPEPLQAGRSPSLHLGWSW